MSTVVNLPAPPNWEEHFHSCLITSKFFSLLKPCMYEGKPYFHGGLKSRQRHFDFDIHDVIVDFNYETYIVPFKQLRPPTNIEYIRYFKKAVETYAFRVSLEGKIVMPKKEKTENDSRKRAKKL